MGLLYPPVAVNRAMKRNEIILKAMSGELSWIRAAEICRITARQMRRLKWAYQKGGYTGLLDRRTGRPSPKRASFPEVERILRLYREEYPGFNMRHFHQKATELHGVKLGYTFVRKALQGAGLVSRRTRRGPHRKRRERKGSLGEMLHLDGSLHVWLSLVPEEKQTLIAIVDDATGKVLEAQLVKAEGTQSVLEALYEVVKIYGIPMALYTDRAGWAFHTPKAGGKVNKDRLTTVGKVLAKLGVEAIPAYSRKPEGAGRGSTARSRIGWSTSSGSLGSERERKPTAIFGRPSCRTTTDATAWRPPVPRVRLSRSGPSIWIRSSVWRTVGRSERTTP